ncbi:6-phosphofructokinase [Jannaschia faecimaris]|uniref:Phosphofructokinase n=1 Tax=Jannaschia faecimaris TaxID=1244108 RepID=A0A1H3S8B0_9RHOB|nr:1-phosphofructokinase family hexose kinase [Jannaschia faecimaris]SDZ34343.1 6-phosphofructokinase [Jannaschia faecimaris]
MPDILTITLNPAVDLATSVKRVVPGPKLYCRSPRVDPGGGGVNVARAIRKLGGRATALVAVGGAMGDRLCDLLAEEEVPTHAVRVRGETRESFAVTDETTGEQFRFSVPGETLGEPDAARLLSEIAAAAPVHGLVVLSGGVAPGLTEEFPQLIQDAIAPRTDKLIVDTSKAPLARLIAQPRSPLLLLRVDQKEAARAAAHAMDMIADSLTFASGLVARGVAEIVVTGRGAEGSVMVTRTGRFLCQAAPVPVRSKIGAGDAFVGAMTLALARGDPPEEALRWGVAAASATVGTEGTELCDAVETAALFQTCSVVAF